MRLTDSKQLLKIFYFIDEFMAIESILLMKYTQLILKFNFIDKIYATDEKI